MFHVQFHLIVNGANGQRGLHAPKVAILGTKPDKEEYLNKKCLVVKLALENLLKPRNVMPNVVQSIVKRANGVLGVNVQKAAMEEFSIDIVP